jgi:hypothetical protein
MLLKIIILYRFRRAAARKRGGGNMKVSPIILLKTHVEKMSETGHAIICMKIRHLEAAIISMIIQVVIEIEGEKDKSDP